MLLDVNRLVSITVGRELDSGVRDIVIDCSSWMKSCPSLTDFRIEVTSPSGIVYLPSVRMDGYKLIWPITNNDTAEVGHGMYQVVATGKNGERKTSAHPDLYIISVMPGAASDCPPSPSQPWVDKVVEAADRAEAAAERAENAGGGGGSDGTGTPGIDGEDGGYYVPAVHEGVLRFTPSKEGMPEVPEAYVRGPKGDPGKDAPADVIRYEEQELTDEQQKQARSNIGAASAEVVGKLSEETIHHIESISFPVAENLLSDSTPVVLGANWTGSIAAGFTHTAGNTEPLTIQVPTEEGSAYYINWEQVGSWVAALYVSIGGTPKVDTYKGADAPCAAIISDGGYLIFTPETKQTGGIKNLSIRKIGSGDTIITKEVLNYDSDTMKNSITGFWNVSIGRNSLTSNVNGSRNIAIGNEALRTLETGTRNIGVGTFAMCYLKYGDRNIAIGADSLWYATHAEDCVAIGMAAMSSKGTSETNLRECIAIGRDAMHKCDDNARNVIAIGRYAGFYAALEDVFIGTRAGYRSGGRGNVAIGDQAFSTTTTEGDGARDPNTANLLGDYNTFVGKNADVADTKTAKHRSTAIGYNAKISKSDQVVLGGDNTNETIIKGDLIVRGTDGVHRRIIFNPATDGVPVGDAQLFNYRDAEHSTILPSSSTMQTSSIATGRTWIIPYDGKTGDKITFNTFVDKTAVELGIRQVFIYLMNEKPITAGLTVLQIGTSSVTYLRGGVDATQDYNYIGVAFQTEQSVTDDERAVLWDEITRRLTVQKGPYVTGYTDYYTTSSGTVTWESVD